MRKLLLVLMLFSVSLTKAQDYFPVNTGVKTSKNTVNKGKMSVVNLQHLLIN